MAELIERIRTRGFLTSTSFCGGVMPPDHVITASDYVLFHGNGQNAPTILGHGLLTNAARTVGGQLASVANLGQVPFAAAMLVVIFADMLDIWVYPGAALIIGGAGVTVRSQPPQR